MTILTRGAAVAATLLVTWLVLNAVVFVGYLTALIVVGGRG